MFADGSVVTLQNQESSAFYYVVDAAALAGLSPGSPLLAARVADFFAAPGDDPAFASLAPNAQVKLTSLADGPHLLVGFFAVRGPGPVSRAGHFPAGGQPQSGRGSTLSTPIRP